MFNYKTINDFNPGQIEELLKICYQGLITIFPEEKQNFFLQWKKEDREAFNNKETIGKHILFSCLSNNVIGYFSWDDRQFPLGLVGQNCILPNYQGQGFGKKQIEFIIKVFQDNNFEEIKAITGAHDFFLPAQKVYLSCGFKEQKRMKGDLFNLIEFSKQI
jgi:GNAT superfamily N-acetyltransferase